MFFHYFDACLEDAILKLKKQEMQEKGKIKVECNNVQVEREACETGQRHSCSSRRSPDTLRRGRETRNTSDHDENAQKYPPYIHTSMHGI